MDALEKLKSKRATVRTAITKLITKCDPLLAVSVDNIDSEALMESLEILIEKENALKELDSGIDELITEKIEYEKELKSVEEYSEKIISLKFKIKNRLAKCKIETKVISSIDSDSKTISKSVSTVKLPKLSIEKFSGDASQFLEFFNTFSNAIDSNDSLTKIEKFQYLKSLLAGPAYNIVAGFELTDNNYSECLNLLQERYGKRENIISCHMNKILELEPVKSPSNIKGLRKLVDNVEISIRNLNSLGVTSGSYGHLLLPLLLKLLPENLILDFHRNKKNDGDSEVMQLIDFLKDELRCREATNYVCNAATKKVENSKYQNKNIPSAAALNASTKHFCIFCKASDHGGLNCSEFNEEQKRYKLKKEGRCYRCFYKSHLSSNCRSKIYPCSKCGNSSHNYLFCNKVNKSENHENKKTTSTIVSIMSEQKTKQNKSTMLQTCCVSVSTENKCILARLLCDSGSEKCFVKRSLVKKLKLKPLREENLLVYPFGRRRPYESCYQVVALELNGIVQPCNSIKIEALVVDNITAATVKTIDSEILNLMKNKGYVPADTGLEQEITILLGSDFLWKIQKGIIEKLTKELYVAETIFGHTVQGQIPSSKGDINCLRVSVESINNQLKDFWNLESLGITETNEKNPMDLEVVKEFQTNLKFVNGRYETRLLWKDSREQLGNNLEVAKKRFSNLESKFMKDDSLFKEYNSILIDQVKQGIVELCTDNFSNKESYYMPHRPVIREDKTTTKVRIVYDASSKADSLSLNECLIPGPNLNPNILDIILKFRIHKIAFSADIEKAFLQISISKEDREYLRFLYYKDFDRNNIVIPYRMTRATFGVTCSPFILACTIKHHISKYENSHKETFEMLNSSIFVDDLFSGENNVLEAFKLSSEAVAILKEAGMNLRKFQTNSEELKRKWVDENIVISNPDPPNTSLKILGLTWNNKEDILGLELRPLLSKLSNDNCTKRNVLKVASMIFDPTGFIAPFVIRIKCILQEMWLKGLQWDEVFSGELENNWKTWNAEIKDLIDLKIPRQYFCSLAIIEEQHLQLHVFSDANPKAYGAVAYLRYKNLENVFSTSFVMSKSRVAPLKKLTLPRLELMGALIGARIARYIENILKISNIVLWTDSEIVLYWIKGVKEKWKPFVKNRISEIHELSDPSFWRHCDGKINPADLITRGCSAKQLINSQKWWHGPEFLSLPEDQWPKVKISEKPSPDISDEQCRKSEKIITCVVLANKIDKTPILNLEKFSSLKRLYRITAWVFRFISNIREKIEKRNFTELSADEISHAETFWLKLVQEETFYDEIKFLKANRKIPKESNLYQLNPILSEENLLVVRGRLEKAKMSFYNRHPVILPAKHKLTELIIWDCHEKVLHAGVSDTLVQTREKFWIIRGRQCVKSVLNNCIICKKFNQRPGQQVIAPLPRDRITESPPFSICGLDFAGPLYVKNSENKYYILLITCSITRAIHLELVKDMTTAEFLLAFRRFISRRGLCSIIYSDNAKTFKRAEREIKEMWKSVNHPDAKRFFADHEITWKYIAERAAWWGGFYERLVRSVKTSLRKTIGRTSQTLSELQTLLVEVEAMINSRPLTYVYSESDEPSSLTPAHFLIGKRILCLPSIKVNDLNLSTKEHLLKRLRLREKLLNHLWKRWKNEYLLQLRSAHYTDQNKASSFKINDVVLVHDDFLPRTWWKLGKVIKTFEGRDGKIRSCELKVNNCTIKRPVQLLYNLEL